MARDDGLASSGSRRHRLAFVQLDLSDKCAGPCAFLPHTSALAICNDGNDSHGSIAKESGPNEHHALQPIVRILGNREGGNKGASALGVRGLVRSKP